MTHSQAERLIAALERIADLMDTRPPEVKDREREDRAFSEANRLIREEADRRTRAAALARSPFPISALPPQPRPAIRTGTGKNSVGTRP